VQRLASKVYSQPRTDAVFSLKLMLITSTACSLEYWAGVPKDVDQVGDKECATSIEKLPSTF